MSYHPESVHYVQPTLGVHTRRLNALLYLLVTLFIGYFGIHRFLRGQIGIGILYLLTAGLFGIGWLIDAICSIIWAFQADPNGNITFINKKYARYQVTGYPLAY